MTPPSDKTIERHAGVAVSDRDLMRHLDGELDAEVADQGESASAAWLRADAAARDKAATMALTGAIVRELVDSDGRADGLADEVMARLFAEGVEPSLDDDLEGFEAALPRAADDDAIVDDDASAQLVAELGAGGGSGGGRAVTTNGAAANDNARVIFALAAAAAAAAAGLFFWGQTEPEPSAVAVAPSPPLEMPVSGPAPFAERPSEPVEEEEPPAPVEVAAVDFGTRSGSVFYVSGHNAATAVVWVTGEVGE